jgi:hypothetical protein
VSLGSAADPAPTSSTAGLAASGLSDVVRVGDERDQRQAYVLERAKLLKRCCLHGVGECAKNLLTRERRRPLAGRDAIEGR